MDGHMTFYLLWPFLQCICWLVCCCFGKSRNLLKRLKYTIWSELMMRN